MPMPKRPNFDNPCRDDIGQAQTVHEANLAKGPRNEIDWLQDENAKLKMEIQEQKTELLNLYRVIHNNRLI